MKLATRRTSTALAVAATAGVSTLFVGATPAFAATEACGDGELIAPGVCEQTFTSGTATFVPTDTMTQLEVLLVGAGGSGADQQATNTNGYAAAGGGGEVRIVDFSEAPGPLQITVPAPGAPGSVTDGSTTAPVGNGSNAGFGGEVGGTSGSGFSGASGVSNSATPYGGGGGAAASPAGNANGGAGVVVADIAPEGSLFTGDTACYGGGGAIGVLNVQGIPGCGGGGPADTTGLVLTAPLANSGGGGGGLSSVQTAEARAGASGVVVLRWTAANITLSFDVAGNGTGVASQSVVPGTAPVRPADPTADGFRFDGWFSDAALTAPADFTQPLTASATFYAKWTPVLPETGAGDPLPQLAAGAMAVLAGAALAGVATARRRQTD